jgi:hypothetical protein
MELKIRPITANRIRPITAKHQYISNNDVNSEDNMKLSQVCINI